MTISFVPLVFPPSADTSRFKDFGREVQGVHPGELTQAEFKEIERALFKHDLLVFRNVDLTPQQQYEVVKAFDPNSIHYGHGDRAIEKSQTSILHSYLTSLPNTPQVQVIGHGTVRDHEGIEEITLKHGRHPEFHKMRISEDDEAKGFTRFFRWHMDAALYDLCPPKVTALYGIKVPKGPLQTVRYDDGTGDELIVPLGTTAFVSGKTMFEILPRELKSVALRARAKYAPHPFQWIGRWKAASTGLMMLTEGPEFASFHELPPWEENKIKAYPFLWKNPITGELHFMVHPLAISEIYIDPLIQGHEHEGALYTDGAHLTDLREVRDLVYKMQRPGIAPDLVYPHPWEEKDLVLFNNRGLMHSVVGVFKEGQIRLFHQCNLAASDEPMGPSRADVCKWS